MHHGGDYIQQLAFAGHVLSCMCTVQAGHYEH